MTVRHELAASVASVMTFATPNPTGGAVRLLDEDADFARAVPGADRELADRALTLPEHRFATGMRVVCPPAEALALVLLEGAVWREVRVAAGSAPQLLDAGGIVLCEPAPAELLGLDSTMTALSPVRAALLDRRFLMAATRWPMLTAILHARMAHQERDLGVLAAIGQLPRVDDRLTALLWHLAGRWGRVRADGVHVPLRLTHATLGRFVGARRPTVSLALAELRERGVADRCPDGTWMLRGTPPAIVADRVAAPPSDLFAVDV